MTPMTKGLPLIAYKVEQKALSCTHTQKNDDVYDSTILSSISLCYTVLCTMRQYSLVFKSTCDQQSKYLGSNPGFPTH